MVKKLAVLGLGELVAAALDRGASRLVLAIGGSASSDGGAGLLKALGARFLDDRGTAIPPGNRGLGGIQSVDLTRLRPLPARGVNVLTYVTSPLLGAEGAACVFGPQKGATATDIPLLEANLRSFVNALGAAAPGTPVERHAETAGAGAAGGTGFGLLVWGATLEAGAEAVGTALGLPALIAGADAVVTGEGRFDGQSSSGTVPTWVRDRAAAAGVDCFLVAGAIVAEPAGFASAVSLTELAGNTDGALADPQRWLTRAGEVLAGALDNAGGEPTPVEPRGEI